jgi:hypothetical protein
MKEPFSRNEAKKRILAIIREGTVMSSKHAKKELAQDDMTIFDAINVLRAGKITEAPEPSNEGWTYRVHTERMGVVVAL